ncbi:MAG: class II aldolase/adducin family protein [Chloroflexi bacterium]|nr:class II aldolase/adducin family protein [Chloroflexota bacterium]
MILAQFQTVGHDLSVRGIVPAHCGDLSIRLGDRVIITRRGSTLAHLTDLDLVETGVERNDRATPAASPTLAVHRAIYRETEAQAVLHGHPAHAIALSLLWDEIVPVDALGIQHFERIPVVGRAITSSSRDMADEIAQALRSSRVVLVRGHGCFAAGQLLEECHQWVSCVEESCRILWLLQCMGRGGPRHRGRRTVLPRASSLS